MKHPIYHSALDRGGAAAGGSPVVTVLMAVYNGESFLRQAIDSILGQTFRDFELLIVDDGSTDGSRAIATARPDPRIRLVQNDHNRGLARSLNRGLALARGALIARQDADDLSEPTRLRRQVAFFERHPDLALLGTWYIKIAADGRPVGRRRLPCNPVEVRWAMLFQSPFVHSAVMLRRSALTGEPGPYDESLGYSMDYDLWRRLARRFPVANLGECLVRIRVSPQSMTATYGDRTLEGHRLRVAEVRRLLAWPEVGDAAERRFLRVRGLLYDPVEPLRAAAVEEAVADLLELFRAFREDARPTEQEAAGLLESLRRTASRQITRGARLWLTEGDGAEARRLLGQARRLYPAVTITPGFATAYLGMRRRSRRRG